MAWRCKECGAHSGGPYCDKCGAPPSMQAGPLMVRHVIDGHEVLLPADAKFNLSDLGATY